MDLRMIKTRQKLFDAYVELLSLENSEKITVQALTKKATINRVTFYKHFLDMKHFEQSFINHHIITLYNFMKPLNYKPYEKGFEAEQLYLLLEHIANQKNLYHILLASGNLPEFNKCLLSYFQSRLTTHTEQLAKFDFPGINVDQEIVSWYGVSALFGTIILWVQSNYKYSAKQLTEAIIKMTPTHE